MHRKSVILNIRDGLEEVGTNWLDYTIWMQSTLCSLFPRRISLTNKNWSHRYNLGANILELTSWSSLYWSAKLIQKQIHHQNLLKAFSLFIWELAAVGSCRGSHYGTNNKFYQKLNKSGAQVVGSCKTVRVPRN